MLLRRLGRRLRDHDWLPVLVEMLVVIAGILIALQLDNWKQARQDASRGDAYLARMAAEMRADAAMIDRMVAFRRQVGREGEAAIANGETGALLDGSAWKTLRAWYQASQIWPYRKPRVAFDEMVARGDLGLVRDAALRSRIAGTYSDNAVSGVVEVLQLMPAYRENVRGHMPWKVQRYIWAHCIRADGDAQALRDCPPPIDEAEAARLLAELRGDPLLLRQLRFWMTTNQLADDILRQVRDQVGTLARDIDAARRQ